MACEDCRGYEVVDHGFELPDNRERYIIEDEDGEVEFADVVVVREWHACSCGVGTDYSVCYEARMPDGRRMKARSESEAGRLIVAAYPTAERDNQWRQDQRTMLMEMGLM